MDNTAKAASLRRGAIVLIVLAGLTALEYWIAVTAPLWFLLLMIALLKASLVIQHYMHIGRLTAEEVRH